MIKGIDCFKKFGLDVHHIEANFMTMWDVPTELEIRELPNRVYCNKLMVEPLSAAFRDLIKTGAVAELKTWDGCYNPRPIRGYEKEFERYMLAKDYINAAKFASLHYWGLAVDVNAPWNKLHMKPTLPPMFVECFTKNGFDWGGNFSRLDGMHFQLAIL